MEERSVGEYASRSVSEGGITVLLVAQSSTVEILTPEVTAQVEHVVTASTIDDALATLDTTPIDCIVTEHELADGTSIDLLDAVRDRHDSTPFILWTADGDERLASRTIAAGATDYVPRGDDIDVSISERIEQAVPSRQVPDSTRVATLRATCHLTERLSQAETIDEGVFTAITEVCEQTEWEYGELWVPDANRDRLEHAASYRLSDEFETLIDITETTAFEKGDGLPGRVWATGDYEWIHDVSSLSPDRYIRTEVAEDSSVNAAVGVPVQVDGRVEAVLAYYLTEPRHPEDYLRQTAEAVAASFGQVIASRRSGTLAGLGESSVPDARQAALADDSVLEFIADHTDVTLWVSTPTLDEIVYLSPSFEAMSGYSCEEFRDSPADLIDIIHPEDRDRVQSMWQNREGAYTFDYRIEAADGTTRWLREHGSPVERDGDVQYFMGKVEDITEQRDREGELERQRELLRHTERIAETGGWEADLETGEQRWTEGTREIHEVSDDFEPTIQSGIDFFHPDDREAIEEAVDQCAEAGEPFDVELRLITANEHLRWVRARGVPVRENDEIVAVRGAVQDITERKERESDLEQTRKRYQTLIETAPDPIVIADVETGEIVETNTAAATLLKQPQEEILGSHYTDLHPSEQTDLYREEFQQHVEREGMSDDLPDGSQMYVETTDGEQVPVSINVKTVSIGDQSLVHGIFRDVSKQKRYENALKAVNSAAQDLLRLETDTEIAHKIVDVGAELADSSAVGVYRYNEQAGELVPVASSDQMDAIAGPLSRITPGDGVVWDVFADQETVKIDDCSATDDALTGSASVRSQLLVPMGEQGVFVICDTEAGAFDTFSIEIGELFCATGEAALARAERTKTLRERERESQRQARRLERVQQLNEKIRTVMAAIVDASSHATITQTVCNSLITLDRLDYVWIGEPDPETESLQVVSEAGVPDTYFESIPLTMDSENSLPAVRATRERDPVVERNIAETPQSTDWRQPALLYEFQSVASVPLIHDDILYGVLSIGSREPDSFEGLTQTVLRELGSLIGYALKTVDQQNALLKNESVALTFDIRGANDAFVELAGRLDADILLKNITSRSENGSFAHFLVEDQSPDDVEDVLDDMPMFKNTRLVSDAESPVFEATMVGQCIATTVASLGADIHRVSVSERNCQINLSVSRERDKQRFLDHLKDRYPHVELKAHRTESNPSPSRTEQLDRLLTERQREIIHAAYYSGFFDQPRESTGTEIADSLGISQPAFSKQLRAAQRKLLETLCEER